MNALCQALTHNQRLPLIYVNDEPAKLHSRLDGEKQNAEIMCGKEPDSSRFRFLTRRSVKRCPMGFDSHLYFCDRDILAELKEEVIPIDLNVRN